MPKKLDYRFNFHGDIESRRGKGAGRTAILPALDKIGDEMKRVGDKRHEFYTEAEIAAMLRTDVKTLRGRRSRGTNHPPYIEIAKGHVLYPKAAVEKWLLAHNIIWEVRHVG